MENSSKSEFGKSSSSNFNNDQGSAGAIGRAGDQAKAYVNKGVDSVTNAATAMQDSALEKVEPLIRYAKERPVQSLLYAAAAGALVVTILRALTPSRD